MKTFIASSVESVDIAHSLQENLDHAVDVSVWDQAFGLSADILEQYLSLIRTYDFAIFILGPDDVSRIRQHRYQVARDNVVFELGVAVATLGKQRTFLVSPRNLPEMHLPSDLAGVVVATYKSERADLRGALGPAATKIARDMARLGSKAPVAHCEMVSHADVKWSELVDSAKKEIVAAGFAMVNIAVVNRKRVIERICASPDLKVRVVLADPAARVTAMRVADENDNLYAAEDIAIVAARLLQERTQVLRQKRRDKALEVRLFRSYPTLAVVVFDDDMYAYSYPFGTLGSEAPVQVFRNYRTNTLAQPYRKHMENVLRASVPASADALRRFLKKAAPG